MNGADVIDVARDAIWVIIMVAGPIMLIALMVGPMDNQKAVMTDKQ